MKAGAQPSGLLHAAFFYRDRAGYLDGLLPFILEGLDRGEPVLVAVPTENLTALRRALNGRAGEVTLIDMAETGANPARTFGMIPDADGRRLRMVGEPVWPGRSEDAYPVCVENEALWNTAYAAHPMTTVCPYDAARLSPQVIADARATHPGLWDGGAAVGNPDFDDTGPLSRCNVELPSPADAAAFRLCALGDLSAARSFARARARSLGLPAGRMADLELIVGELTTNSLKYTVGGCRLALWPKPGGLVCEVRDSGRLDDPLAGRRLPAAFATGGRGLFLVNAMADLVRIHRSAQGTTIQAHLDYDATVDHDSDGSGR